MYARVITARIEPRHLDDAISLWQEEVAPSVRQQKGLISARLFVDREGGEVLSMGLWQTRADFDATVEWNNGQLAKFVALLSGEPQVRGFDLAAEASP
jgi:quinol monooxygenase YgiN